MTDRGHRAREGDEACDGADVGGRRGGSHGLSVGVSLVLRPGCRRPPPPVTSRHRQNGYVSRPRAPPLCLVLRELKRGGQVFFLHNEVDTIENMRERLETLLPEARIGVAHGQLRERELEQVMVKNIVFASLPL